MIFSGCILAVLTFCSFPKANSGHILILTPPILSHILPSLELAKQLSAYTHVTFLISVSVLEELERKDLLSTTYNNGTLDIVGLIDGSIGPFSLDAHPIQNNSGNRTKKAPPNEVKYHHYKVLVQIQCKLQQLFRLSINVCPTSTTSDYSARWSTQKKFVTKPIFRPIDMVIAESFTPVPFLDIFVPVHIFISYNLKGLVISLRKRMLKRNREGKRMSHFLPENIHQASGYLSNSWKEFDEEHLSDFYQLSKNQAPVRFVGPLTLDDEKTQNSQTDYIIQWLNKQPVASIIYVAFGSLIRLQESTIRDYARALQSSSFIWSLKRNFTSPSLFPHLDDTRQLVLDWTPQRVILAHRSVSFFICHGGWNSIMEGMINGKAILVSPMFGDQFSNAQRIVALGIGRQSSKNLRVDIQHMKRYTNYTQKAKKIQSIVQEAKLKVLKKEMSAIAHLLSKETNRWGQEL